MVSNKIWGKCMNPRLVSFVVDLQSGEKVERNENKTNFKPKGGKKFIGFLKPAEVTVPVNHID